MSGDKNVKILLTIKGKQYIIRVPNLRKGFFTMKKTIVKISALALVAIMMCAILVACDVPNSDPSKALQALKDNDYVAEKIDSSVALGVLKLAGIDDVTAIVSGTAKIDDKVEHVTIIYFEDKEAADAEWEDVQKYMEDDKEQDGDESEWVIKKSGNMIYYGTKAGIKAAK